MQQNLAASKQQAEALAEQLEANKKALEKLSARAALLAQALQKTESRVDSEEGKAADIETERRTKQREFDQRRHEYARTITSLLALQRIPPTAMFANPETLEPTLQAARILQNTHKALGVRAAELKQDMRTLASLKTRAGNQQTILEKEKARLADEQAALRRDIVERQKLHKQLTSDHEKTEARVAALSRQATSLQDLLNRLAKESRKKPSALPSQSFAKAKGAMQRPVSGNVLHQFGDKKNENETWRGMVLRARPKGTVTTPYEGEVAFAGTFRDYGRMVLIRHGNGYISLLAGLGNIDVSLNQFLRRGEPVGTMPNTPTPELYVELREGSKPIDPADWFANVSKRLATH